MNFEPIVRIEAPKPEMLDANSDLYISNKVEDYGFFL